MSHTHARNATPDLDTGELQAFAPRHRSDRTTPGHDRPGTLHVDSLVYVMRNGVPHDAWILADTRLPEHYEVAEVLSGELYVAIDSLSDCDGVPVLIFDSL